MSRHERVNVPGRPGVEAISVTLPPQEAKYTIYDMCSRPLRAKKDELCWTNDGYVQRTPEGEPDLLMPSRCTWERSSRCRVAAGKLLLQLPDSPEAEPKPEPEPAYHEPPATMPTAAAEERAALQPRPPIHPGELGPGGPLL